MLDKLALPQIFEQYLLQLPDGSLQDGMAGSDGVGYSSCARFARLSGEVSAGGYEGKMKLDLDGCTPA